APFPRALPVQIEVDNTVSQNNSIIEVFSPDRPGLLSVIARAFFDLGLSVQTARVATQLDQIVDIFHVTDEAGQKITDSDRIQHLKQALTREIEQYLAASRAA
ncbi:MAG TPA: ACT domain-containing protein, partial [Nitrospiria bacterium]